MSTEREPGVDWYREIELGRPLEHLPLLAQMAGVEVPDAIRGRIESARSSASAAATPSPEAN